MTPLLYTGADRRMPPIKRRYLPSLGSFATFEVAAKHLSFTLAAKELNVTQGAVSQQIRLLEKALDVALFVRKHNALELTAEGATLFASVTTGLDSISAGVSTLSKNEGAQTITITATDGMSSYWLKPLIDGFRLHHPEISFVVLASDEDDTIRNYSEVDMSLMCGNERCEVGEVLHFLFQEVAQPVCSPRYLEEYGPFDDAAQLQNANLLHLHDRHWSAGAISWRPMGWEEWFGARGVRWENPPFSLSTNKYRLLTDAALAGEGVMLGWHHMVRRLIDEGRLVFAHPEPITSARGNFLNCRQKSMMRPAVELFVSYLLASERPQPAL